MKIKRFEDAEAVVLGSYEGMTNQNTAGVDALRFLWDYLGWTGSKRPAPLGLICPLHAEFKTYRETAKRLCQRFDARFPFANLCPPTIPPPCVSS